MNIPIVYEDDYLVVVDKPSGLLTIPTIKNGQRTLTSVLNDDLKARGMLYRLHPCHRLDRETSGLIIYAKGKSTQAKMMDLFKQKKVKKTYLTLVKGNPAKSEGKINFPIESQSAQTNYQVLERRKNFSIIKVMPLTGRKNQIRIHFKAIGHPILGESKFAFRKDFDIKAKRLCLHAAELEFIHPLTNKKINLSSDLPVELEKILSEND